MNSTPNPALDKIIESSYDRANNKFVVNTSDASSSVLIVGDDYTGTDTHNPVYVDANGFIGTNIVTSTHQDIVYGFDEMASILTVGNITPWSKVNPVSSDENGWYTTYVSGISSLLWYNNGPYGTQQTFNYQTEFAFNKLDLWFMTIKQYRPLTGSAGSPIMPTIRIFSKPTGTNDAIGGVCHSFWDYTMTAGQAINYGESIVIYSGQVNKIKLNHSELRRIVYTNTSGGGDRGNNEVINHIEFIYNTPNVYNTLVIEAGVFINQVGLINYYFSNGNTSKADIATIAMKTATDTINTNVSAINTKLSPMTFTTNRLQTDTIITNNAGNKVGASVWAGEYYLHTIDAKNLSYNTTYTLINNQIIIAGNAQASITFTQSLAYRRDAVLQWYDDGARTELGGIAIYADQGFLANYVYLGTLFPTYDTINNRRAGTLAIDGTKYTGFYFQNLGSNSITASCKLIMS
jgi:hypothetical protein